MTSTSHAQTLVPADDPRIQYSGRVDFADPKAPRFDWSGISLQFRLEGPGLSFLLDDPQDRFDVRVDGRAVTVLAAQKGKAAYPLEGLGPGEHRVELVRRTEASWGVTTFRGLSLPPGAKLLDPPARPARRLEVIGDSWVCGYGNEAATTHCDDLLPYENADRAFGLVAARELKAECRLVCYSGRGVVRNYGDPKPRSAEPFPDLMDRLLCAEPESRCNDAAWRPDAVVVHLGTNDFSTEPHPDPEDFQRSSVALLAHLRAQYPQASLFWFAATGWPDYYPAVERAVAARHAAGDAKVYCVGYPPVPADQMGCDFHPNVKVHQKLATLLTRSLRQKLGW